MAMSEDGTGVCGRPIPRAAWAVAVLSTGLTTGPAAAGPARGYVSARAYQAALEGARATAAGRFDDAVAAYKNALVYDPNSLELRDRLWSSWARLGEWAELSASLSRDRSPGGAAQALRAFWHSRHDLAVGDRRSAVRWAQRAVRFAPDTPRFERWLRRLVPPTRRGGRRARGHARARTDWRGPAGAWRDALVMYLESWDLAAADEVLAAVSPDAPVFPSPSWVEVQDAVWLRLRRWSDRGRRHGLRPPAEWAASRLRGLSLRARLDARETDAVPGPLCPRTREGPSAVAAWVSNVFAAGHYGALVRCFPPGRALPVGTGDRTRAIIGLGAYLEGRWSHALAILERMAKPGAVAEVSRLIRARILRQTGRPRRARRLETLIFGDPERLRVLPETAPLMARVTTAHPAAICGALIPAEEAAGSSVAPTPPAPPPPRRPRGARSLHAPPRDPEVDAFMAWVAGRADDERWSLLVADSFLDAGVAAVLKPRWIWSRSLCRAGYRALRRGQPERARQRFWQAMLVEPYNEGAVFGWMASGAGTEQDARILAARLPRNPDVLRLWAGRLAAEGDSVSARRVQRRAAQLARGRSP